MKIKELMTKDVAYCEPSTSLNEAARMMWERDCGSIPVCQGDRQVIGMITDRDICMAAYHQGKPLNEMRVQDAMSHQLISCRPDDDVSRAESRMREGQVRRLPVVDEQSHLVGIITLGRIAREASDGRRGDITEREVVSTIAAVHRPIRESAQA